MMETALQIRTETASATIMKTAPAGQIRMGTGGTIRPAVEVELRMDTDMVMGAGRSRR